MVKTGDLKWEGGEHSAEAYQARWKQRTPEKRAVASPTKFDDDRVLDVDGHEVLSAECAVPVDDHDPRE